MRKQRINPTNGYVIFEDDVRIAIATGFKRKSENRKTGDMIQIWILVKAQNPVRAIKSGLDVLICGNCSMRGVKKARGRRARPRLCYVNAGQAPLMVWKVWMRGGYPPLTNYDVFSARTVRFGAYGDPVHIPLDVLQSIAARASKRTGYTHQWRDSRYAGYRGLIMASCDSATDASDAHAMGWRSFRVRASFESLRTNEINCPASLEGGNRTQCARCGLCNGAHGQKQISIIVHGPSARNFVSIDSLTHAA